MDDRTRRIVLIEPDERKRAVLTDRLQSQGFHVEAFGDPSVAANWTLGNPPDALIADVWMSGVSGVQLCRLLRSEPATSTMPIILRAEGNTPKDRFWAEQAGAESYVPKGRIGELVRAVQRAIASAPEQDGFFTQLAQTDIRDRIAQQLDRALFESVISSSVRALGTCESFARLFDLFSQFVCRVATYRWLGVCTDKPSRIAVHCHPAHAAESVALAHATFLQERAEEFVIEDEDATDLPAVGPLILHDVAFGATKIGRLAVQPVDSNSELPDILRLISLEISGPLRIVTLVDESRRLALYDPLTGIMNRRAFTECLHKELAQARAMSRPLSCILLDVDHFKQINDRYGHRAGDRVLSELGVLAKRCGPPGSAVARWGGEEFVIGLPNLALSGAHDFAEALRSRIEALPVQTDDGRPIPVTASLGVAELRDGDTFESVVERADQAMYAAKVAGRNRVEVATPDAGDAGNGPGQGTTAGDGGDTPGPAPGATAGDGGDTPGPAPGATAGDGGDTPGQGTSGVAPSVMLA